MFDKDLLKSNLTPPEILFSSDLQWFTVSPDVEGVLQVPVTVPLVHHSTFLPTPNHTHL